MIARQQAVANRKGPPEVGFGLDVSILGAKGFSQIVQTLAYFGILRAVGLFEDLQSFPELTVRLRVAATLQCQISEVIQNRAHHGMTGAQRMLYRRSASA
jgi:hypothetical protein